MARFRKDDIEFHGLGYGYEFAPAVNVKTNGGFISAKVVEQVALHNDEPTFVEWWDQHADDIPDDALHDYWGMACEDGWEQIKNDAEEIFGPVKVYSEGRSDGWAYIEEFRSRDGENPVESWDAIMVAKWGKWARWCKLIADDVPYQMVQSIFGNLFLPEHEEATKRAYRALLRDAS